MRREAIRASGTPVAFETYGTVREARGFTSRTYTMPSSEPLPFDPPIDMRGIANWMFISPTTFSARASLNV